MEHFFPLISNEKISCRPKSNNSVKKFLKRIVTIFVVNIRHHTNDVENRVILIFVNISLAIFYWVCIINFRGRLAQLVERLPYKEDVGSSSLSTPTIKKAITIVIAFLFL